MAPPRMWRCRANDNAFYLAQGLGEPPVGRVPPMCSWSEVPAGHDEPHTVPRDVVLDAHVVLRPISAEDPAGGLGVDVVERCDPHAAVGQQVVIDTVREAVPDVVVALELVAVLVDHPVGV